MSIRAEIKYNSYQDSVKLMQVSEQIRAENGIINAIAIMGTEANKATLAAIGLPGESLHGAGPNDIILVVEGEDEVIVKSALARFEKLLDERVKSDAAATYRPKTIAGAMETVGAATLAVISVPGEYAAYEAAKALRLGLNVLIFSDNVSLDDEIELKNLGRQLGLLVMGPDCGTAIIGGKPVCFANDVARGKIGIVGASGTGIQQISVIVNQLGAGVSHAIGTGSRDLSDQVSGITTLAALDALSEDDGTEVIVVVSKPPGEVTAKRIIDRARLCPKPVVLAFLGSAPAVGQSGLFVSENLEEAAAAAVALSRGEKAVPGMTAFPRDSLAKLVADELSQLESGRKYLKGLFCGGSMAGEAALLLKDHLGSLVSNIAAPGVRKVKGTDVLETHAVIDMGEDEFTRGRPHPMIDPRFRAERLRQEYANPETAVILCDLVLGYGSHSSPAEVLAEAVCMVRTELKHYVSIISSVCGTDTDPQNRGRQEKILREAGIVVLPTNACAAEAAGRIVRACLERG